MSQFSPSGAAGSTSTVILSGASNPTVANVSIGSANTEYNYLLPTNTKKFHLKMRDGAALKLAYTIGTTGTTYVTIPAYNMYTEDQLSVTAVTLYFQTPSPSGVVEIISWT